MTDEIAARRLRIAKTIAGRAGQQDAPAADPSAAFTVLAKSLEQANNDIASLTGELNIANQRASASDAECARLRAMVESCEKRAVAAESAVSAAHAECDRCREEAKQALIAHAAQVARADAAEQALAAERARPAPTFTFPEMPTPALLPVPSAPAVKGWTLRVGARGPNGEMRELKLIPDGD